MATIPRRKKSANPAYDACDVEDTDNTSVGSPKIDAILGKVKRYDALRSEETKAKNAKTELGKELKQLAVDLGEERNGSFVLELPQGASIASRAKRSQVVDHEKACKILTELGLLDKCTRRVIDDSALMLAFQEGAITLDKIEEFTTESISHSVEVKAPKK